MGDTGGDQKGLDAGNERRDHELETEHEYEADAENRRAEHEEADE